MFRVQQEIIKNTGKFKEGQKVMEQKERVRRKGKYTKQRKVFRWKEGKYKDGRKGSKGKKEKYKEGINERRKVQVKNYIRKRKERTRRK